MENLELDLKVILEWFRKNLMKANFKQFHDIGDS